MQKGEFSFFLESLKTINDIKFTPKEIDIMACILGGRGRKATGSLLTISEKTVEAHIRNISQKLECNSQETIREYLEKSNKFAVIRSRYLNLLANASFEKHLQKVHTLIKKSDLACFLISWQEMLSQKSFTNQLEKHLALSGLKVIVKENNNFLLH